MVFVFQMLFNETPCQHPIIIIKDMSYNHLRTLIEFMYYGEVNISQDQLPVILKVSLFNNYLCINLFTIDVYITVRLQKVYKSKG